MRKNILILALLVVCSLQCLSAKEELLKFSQIPDSLKVGASSVVLLDRTDVEIKSMTEGKECHTRVVTILNRKAEKDGWFSCSCSQYSKLKSFNGAIYDRNGRLIREFGKSDLSKTEYSPYLASDGYGYMLELSGPSYPYTVRYEWEIELKNSIFYFPAFSPIESYRQALVLADYKIMVTEEMGCAVKEINVDQSVISRTKTPKMLEINASLSNVCAVDEEPFSGKLSEKVPSVLFAPKKFVFDKTKGELLSWETLGNWAVLLAAGRDKLSEEEKVKIHAMTDTCLTMRNKVKVLYDYLAKTTRYVNVSLGIGGFQPAPAEKVAQWKFGDCKGLSNYMCAMLREVGIEAWNATISTRDADLYDDFTSFGQLNHMIACVVMPQDTVWLECTEPTLPFGYVHSSIAGHEATLLHDKGGKLVRLPSYQDTTAYVSKKSEVFINQDATVLLKVSELYTIDNYEYARGLKNQKFNDVVRLIRNATGFSDGEITNFNIVENKTATPSLNVTYDVTGKKLVRRTGNRIFIPVNIFNNGAKKYKAIERSRPYEFENVLAYDDVTINVPDDYVVESVPDDITISTPYFEFSSRCVQEDGKIEIVQRKHMKKGKYPVEIEQEFTENYNKMVELYNARIVLKREK